LNRSRDFFTRRICGLEKLSYSERLNILGLGTLNRRRVIFDLILCYKYLHGLVEINNCNFIRSYQSPRTRGNGMKLYKGQCSIDARHQFFSNSIVDIWDSLPAAAVLLIICVYVFYVMYFTAL